MSRANLSPALALIACAIASNLAACACELCAIYGATSARSEATGPVFTVAEQYISEHRLQYHSHEVIVDNPEFLDSSITHVIGGYNLSRNLGVNLNVPIIRRDFRIYDADTGAYSEGRAQGFGDIALIGRWTPYSSQSMSRGFRVNLLAGIKAPTGDTRYLREDVAQKETLDAIYGVGHDHAFSAVHLHDLTLGSGSFDGIFGITATARYKRAFVTAEAQYYLRTEGESGFRFGDTVMVSGGPGAYLVLRKSFTLNLQAVARFENTEHSEYSGAISSQTGMREIYAGPQFTVTAGGHFSAQAGVDLPIDIRNSGFQVVPDYRVHGSFTWSF
jgi:hypothetical protein